MNKLIEKDDCGNWSLKGVRWSNLMPGSLITKDTYEKVYAALWKLMEYEDTGLSLDDVESVNKFEGSNTQKYLLEIEKSRWIPVDERTPEDDEYILLSFSNFSLPMVGRFEDGAFYLGDEEDTCVSQDLFVNAWRYLPAPHRPAEE